MKIKLPYFKAEDWETLDQFLTMLKIPRLRRSIQADKIHKELAKLDAAWVALNSLDAPAEFCDSARNAIMELRDLFRKIQFLVNQLAEITRKLEKGEY